MKTPKYEYDIYLSNPYAQLSRQQNYLFIYVRANGGALYGSKGSLLFLYNSTEETLIWAKNKHPFPILGKMKISETKYIESLFRNAERKQSNKRYDCGYYLIYMSNDYHEDELVIYHAEKHLYPKFGHIFSIVDATL